MKTLRKIYTAYGFIVFTLTFLVLLPFFLMAIYIKPLEGWAGPLNRFWAKSLFFLLFLHRSKIRYETELDKKQRYIFCANHFSYLDIPTLGLIKHNFKFIGKSSLKKVPLWGFMYSKLHILVDRSSLRSRHASWLQVQEKIREGFSIAFFPEGGIYSKNPPQMARFKDGSFRIAVEEQIPIVPVTIHNNHIILPDKRPFIVNMGVISLQVHKPIWPQGTGDEAANLLKEQVFEVIQGELNKVHNASR